MHDRRVGTFGARTDRKPVIHAMLVRAMPKGGAGSTGAFRSTLGGCRADTMVVGDTNGSMRSGEGRSAPSRLDVPERFREVVCVSRNTTLEAGAAWSPGR